MEYPSYAEGQNAKCPHCGEVVRLTRAIQSQVQERKERRQLSHRFIVALASLGACVLLWLAAMAADAKWGIISRFAGETVGMLAGLAIFAFLLLIAILWIIFPFMVWIYLRRIDTHLQNANRNSQELLARLMSSRPGVSDSSQE